MVGSLPQVSEASIKRGLAVLKQHNGKVPKELFRIIDKNRDVNLFFKYIRVIKEESKTDQFVEWSTEGKLLVESINDPDRFAKIFHSIMMARIPQYLILAELLATDETFSRKELLDVLRKQLSKRGWNITVPTFNVLLSIGKMTHLVEKNGNLYGKGKALQEVNYFQIFKACIERLKADSRTEFIETKGVVSCIMEKMKNLVNLNLVLDLLQQYKDKLDIMFEPGVGGEGIPGSLALIRIEKRL